MILVGFGKIPDQIRDDELALSVNRAFGEKNEKYVAEITCRGDEKGKIHSLCALLCLHEMLKSMSGADVCALKLARGENGKPYFESSALQFGLSHSHGYVACALSDEGEVGIDVEASELTDERAARLAQRYLHRDSCDAKAFAREWTIKEAEVKLHGGRLGEHLAKTDDVTPNVFFTEFEIDGHPITLCTEKEPSKIEKIDVKFDF
jgi:hypothetical protein